MTETTISVVDSKMLMSIFGPRDQHLRRIRGALGVNISARDHQVRISGEDDAVARATEVFEELKRLAQRHGGLSTEQVNTVLGHKTGIAELTESEPSIDLARAAGAVRPKTKGQASFIRTVQENDVVFCIGPAGTGKTYLSVAMAVAALRAQQVRKIVLVRPAVEAGESLGYLPGDMHSKIHPYLRPLLDALREMLDYDQIRRYYDEDVVEVIPLAYMRGRTLNEAFIILDEAQNTTVPQMKMFLTRMGQGSKIVVSGDHTQIDLPHHTRSGLIDALERLQGIEGLGVATLTNADIVRHRLVDAIVRAYEKER